MVKYDAGRIFEKPFIKMGYVGGHDLNRLQEKYGIFNFEYSVKVIKSILNGLEYAADKGIVHSVRLNSRHYVQIILMKKLD